MKCPKCGGDVIVEKTSITVPYVRCYPCGCYVETKTFIYKAWKEEKEK